MSRYARVGAAMLALLLFLGLVPVAAQGDGAGDLPVCPSEDALICRVDRVWTAARLAARTRTLQPGHATFFMSGRRDEGVFVYRGLGRLLGDSAPSMLLEGETPMLRVEDSELWTLTFRLDNLRAAILGIGLRAGSRLSYPFITWFGPDAPTPPVFNEPLLGTLQSEDFESEALGAARQVSVYVPPGHDPAQRYPVIYMSDGDMLPPYAAVLDHLIEEGQVVPTLLVGVASAESYPANRRGLELVPGADETVFGQFEQLFTEEVRAWAETTLGASQEREQRAILGVSNGGLFALAMVVRHPDLYGIVFPFSAGASAGFEPPAIDPEAIRLPLRIYSTAGTLEPLFLLTTRALLDELAAVGAETVLVERVAGHDNANWLTTFAEAAPWAFPAPPADEDQ